MGRQLGCKDNGFTHFNSRVLQILLKTNGRGRTTSLIYPGCLSAASSSSSVGSSTTGLKTCEVYPALPASSVGASCSQPCPSEPPVESTNSHAWAPLTPFHQHPLAKARYLYLKKLPRGGYTQPRLTILEPFIKSCWSSLPVSPVHPLVLYFHCSWFGSSPYHLSEWQKQVPISSFLLLVNPPNCHQIYFSRTQIPTCHPSALNPPMAPLRVNDGACLFLRWWWRTAASYPRQAFS